MLRTEEEMWHDIIRHVISKQIDLTFVDKSDTSTICSCTICQEYINKTHILHNSEDFSMEKVLETNPKLINIHRGLNTIRGTTQYVATKAVIDEMLENEMKRLQNYKLIHY